MVGGWIHLPIDKSEIIVYNEVNNKTYTEAVMADEKNMIPEEEMEEVEVYTLTDEEGNESDFEFIGRIELDGNTYVAIAPTEYYVLKKVTSTKKEDTYIPVEGDELDNISGKLLFIYADGLNEAENLAQEQYGDNKLQQMMQQLYLSALPVYLSMVHRP